MAKDIEEYTVYVNGEAVCVDRLELHDLEKENNPKKQKINKISSPKNIFEDYVEYHSSVTIKSENSSEKYNLLNVTDFQTHWVPGTTIFNGIGEIQIKNETNDLEYEVECEIEDTRILFDTGECINTCNISTQDVQSSSKFTSDDNKSNIVQKSLSTQVPTKANKCEDNHHGQLDFARTSDLMKNLETPIIVEDFEMHKNAHLVCPECEKIFLSTDNLSLHLMIHKLKGKPYSCKYCDLRFGSKSTMKKHEMSKHSTDDPYKCSECNKGFTSVISLRYHARHHRSKVPYKCTGCSKVYWRKENLKYHQLSQHLEVEQTLDYKCLYCDKVFMKKRTLELHQASHCSDSKQ